MNYNLDAVVSMVTGTMTTTEGDEATVCANLDNPSGGTSVPITVVLGIIINCTVVFV